MSVDDRTDSFDDAVTRSDHTDPDDVHSLAERLRRQVRDARGGQPADIERTRKVDTDPYAFDTAPTAIENETPTIMDPELTPSAENAPELVAALAQFSGRALQEAKFQAASDGRGAARYAALAAPARSIGVVDPNAGEVIVAPNTTQPFLPAAARMPRPHTPGAQLAPVTPSGPFAQPALPERVAVTRKLNLGAAAAADTTIPGLRGRKGPARQQRVVVLLLGALVLVVAAVLLFRTVTATRPEVDTSLAAPTAPAQGPTVTATSSATAAAAPASQPVPVAPATTPAPSASATMKAVPTSPPPSVPASTPRRPEPAPHAPTQTNTAAAASAVSTHTPPASPASSAPPKPINGKGDFVW